MSLAEELAIKHKLYHVLSGPDGDVYVADTRAVAAIDEAIELTKNGKVKLNG